MRFARREIDGRSIVDAFYTSWREQWTWFDSNTHLLVSTGLTDIVKRTVVQQWRVSNRVAKVFSCMFWPTFAEFQNIFGFLVSCFVQSKFFGWMVVSHLATNALWFMRIAEKESLFNFETSGSSFARCLMLVDRTHSNTQKCCLIPSRHH